MSKGKRYAPRGQRSRKSSGQPQVLILTAIAVLLAVALLLVWKEKKVETPNLPPASEMETPPSAPQQADDATVPPQQPEAPSVPKPPEVTPPAEPTKAELLLADMTLKEKVYQMFVVFPSAITGVSPVTAAGETTKKALETYPVGGFLYDKTNLVSQEQTRTMLSNVQSYSDIPLILTCDEEGGRVNRLMGTIGTTWVGPMLDYRDEGPSRAAENAETIAADLYSIGFNIDLAPVADVWSNPNNTVIGDRAYSTDFEEAAQLVASAVSGFHEGGVACTLKHFPGHGDTSADSHYGSVYVYKTLEELRAAEFLPFRSGIEAGADAVMMGHLIVKDIDEEPALFSRKIVTELLRQELGFDGVIMTDSLQMQAMTDHYGSGEIAVKAVKAGVDILLCPMDLEAAANALMEAVESGALSEAEINEHVLRILTLKQARGIL